MAITIHVIVLLAAVVLGLLIYKYDMYDREPWFLILLAVFLGGLSAWSIGYVEDWLILRTNVLESILGQALIASTCEESCKVAIIFFIALCFRSWFNDPMDGIVYGALAGLGFGLEESRFYLEMALNSGAVPSKMELFGQEAVRLLLHFLTGGIDGFGIGLVWAKFPVEIKVKNARLLFAIWLSVGFAVHFLWDYACGIPQGQATMLPRLFAVVLMLVALIFFGAAVMVGVPLVCHCSSARRRRSTSDSLALHLAAKNVC